MNATAAWLKNPKLYFFAGMLAVIVVSFHREESKARHIESNLVQEYRKVEPEIQLQRLSEERFHKPSVVYIRARFSTHAGSADVENVYRSELEKNGWIFMERRVYPSQLQALEFCKWSDAGAYAAVLELFDRVNSTQGILFEMNWGINKCRSFLEKQKH